MSAIALGLKGEKRVVQPQDLASAMGNIGDADKQNW